MSKPYTPSPWEKPGWGLEPSGFRPRVQEIIFGRVPAAKVGAKVAKPPAPEITKIKLGVLTEAEADYLNRSMHGMYHDYRAGEPITNSIETYLDEMPGRVLSPRRKAEIAIERKIEKLTDKIEELDERIETAESAGKDTRVLEKQRQLFEDEIQRLEDEVIPEAVVETAEEAGKYSLPRKGRKSTFFE